MSAATDTLSALHEKALAAYRESFPVHAATPALRALIGETLENPGGLVRLKLGLITGHALGLDAEASRRLSVSFEYFHTASLLLDDLPCMDDAHERRGRPCPHLVHGEATAILGAMAFINRAYALAWSALDTAPASRRSAAAAHLERCLGESGILDGQCMDLRFAETDRSPCSVARVALGKTVALLRLVLVTPALLTTTADRERKLLDRLSVYWGLAYQIADDWTDVAASRASGKTAERDAALGRPNYLLAAGAVSTLSRLDHLLRHTQETVERLTRERPAWQCLRDLVTQMVDATADRTARQPADGLRCA